MKFVTDLGKGILGTADSPDLWGEIISHIPDNVLTDPNTKILNVACGHLTEARLLVKRMMGLGVSAQEANEKIYVLDKYSTFTNAAKMQGYKNVICADFMEWETDMRFDVILGNPPYNGVDTAREGSNHRGQGENLAKKFALKSLELCDGYMSFVMPYGHRTFSPALKENFRQNGLYRVDSCEEYFKQVSTNPAVFYFNKNQVVEDIEDNFFDPGLEIPSNNIGDIFKNQPGRLNRVDYESKLGDTGKYRVRVTTAVVGFTDDEDIVAGMNDKTVGNWRVVFNCTTSKQKIGRIEIEGPDSILSKSVHCLIVDSKSKAQKLADYLQTPEVMEIIQKVKTVNACNSKKFLEYVPTPEFL